MSVTSVNSAIPTVQAEDPYAEKFSKTLGKDEFMTLFITQLQHQDPLAPLESYEMAAQLAQFSSVETMMSMDKRLEEMLAYQTSENNLQIVSLLDKNVQASDNKLGLNNGIVTATEFGLDEDVTSCIIEITDANSHLVRTLDLGKMEAGLYELAWDGKNTAENAMPDGQYSYVVKGLTSTGEYSPVEYRTSGRVTGLSFDSGQATLTIDNQIEIGVGDILKIIYPKNATATADPTGDAIETASGTENVYGTEGSTENTGETAEDGGNDGGL